LAEKFILSVNPFGTQLAVAPQDKFFRLLASTLLFLEKVAKNTPPMEGATHEEPNKPTTRNT